MNIDKLTVCCGCHACYSICPESAITMSANHEGFLYPVIDKEKCIGCGLCTKICVVLNQTNRENENTEAFAAINKNEKIRKQSSSGGIFTAIAEKVIKESGVVFGAKFTDDFSVIHGWAETEEGIAAFRGSKYVQSIIGNAYKECKDFLDAGRYVFFTGTPCQIAGLKAYLQKDYDTLLTADIICHGVPSPLLWKKYIEFHEKQSASQIVKTTFRHKNYGWKLFSLSFIFANGNEYILPLCDDQYGKMFLKSFCLRNSCYACKQKGIKRVSDITLSDFWGIQFIIPILDDNKGCSFVITHSTKGTAIVRGLADCCEIIKVHIEQGGGVSTSADSFCKETFCS